MGDSRFGSPFGILFVEVNQKFKHKVKHCKKFQTFLIKMTNFIRRYFCGAKFTKNTRIDDKVVVITGNKKVFNHNVFS
jgi:hypothetical protein